LKAGTLIRRSGKVSVEALVAVQEGDKKFPVTMVRYIVGTASIAFKEIQPPGSASSRGTR